MVFGFLAFSFFLCGKGETEGKNLARANARTRMVLHKCASLFLFFFLFLVI